MLPKTRNIPAREIDLRTKVIFENDTILIEWYDETGQKVKVLKADETTVPDKGYTLRQVDNRVEAIVDAVLAGTL